MKRWHWFEIFLLIIVLGVHLYAAFSAPHNFSTRWFLRDDAYYYFKVAQNISEGHGSTFDGINPTNGYHPLWMLVCIPIFALARFDLILPLRVLMMVMALLSAATSILLFRLLKKYTSEPVAIVAASFWAFNMLVHETVTQNGMETGILAFSLLVFLTLFEKFERQPAASATTPQIIQLALAALFVLFSRLDTIYLAVLAGAWIVFRGKPLRYLLPADLFIVTSIVVAAYIERAGIKIYMAAYSESAIAMAALIFLAQFVAFYFLGLYRHPRELSILQLAKQTLIGVTIAALAGAAATYLVSLTGWITFSRAVPVYYWIGGLILTLALRLLIHFTAPMPGSRPLSPSPLEQLRAEWKQWFSNAFSFYGIIGAALGLYMLFNRLNFGTFMPVSGQVKRWWGSLLSNVYGGGAKTLLDVFGIDPDYSSPWWMVMNPLQSFFDRWLAPHIRNRNEPTAYWVMMILFTVAALALFIFNRKKNYPATLKTGLVLLGFSASFHVLFYGAISYSAQHDWYWIMQMISILMVLALLAQSLLHLLPKISIIKSVTTWAAIAIAVWQAAIFSWTIYDRMPYQDPLAGQRYIDMLDIIEANTEPGAIIGMTGGGNVGYYIKDRTIVNMDGLINSYPYFQALQANQAGDYLEKIGMKYIFANPDILLETAPYNTQFQGRIQEIPGIPAYGRKELLRFVHPASQ